MSAIYIEGKPVAGFVSGHLYLVYVDDSGAEFVIRGGPANNNVFDFGPIAIQDDIPLSLSKDARPPGVTPEDRGRREIPLGGRSASDVWNVLVQQGHNINNADIPYAATGNNSNTVVGNLLGLVGVDVSTVLPNPSGIELLKFTSYNNKLSFDYSINGTADDDTLVGGGCNQTFFGGNGNDLLEGGEGNNVFNVGSIGTDTIIGGPGHDTIDDSASQGKIVNVTMALGESLEITTPSKILGTIKGLTAGNTLELDGIGTASDASISSDNLLSVTEANGTLVGIHLDPGVDYTGTVVAIQSDDKDGSILSLQPATDHTITFSEYPIGTVNPSYRFPDNTVTFEGEIVSDSAQPATPAVAANASYVGPVFINFKSPVTHVDFDAGYFDEIGSTTITFIGPGGTVLESEQNATYGIVHYSLDEAGGISAVNIVNTGYDDSGFSVDTVHVGETLGQGPADTGFGITLTNEALLPDDPVYSFTVIRTGDTSVASSVGYGVTGTGINPLTAADLQGGLFPVGQVNFAAGQVSQVITVNVLGGFASENPKTFAVTLLAPSVGTIIGKDAAAAATTLQPPTIATVGASVSTTVGMSIAPFAGAVIHDPNASQTETLTVSLSGETGGALTNLGGGIYNAATGIYTDIGSDVEVTAALEGLLFTSGGGEGSTTDLTVKVTDGASATASTETTVEVKSASPVAAIGPEIELLYATVLGRASDVGGLAHYVGLVERQGLSLTQVADEMILSPEFQSVHGTPDDNTLLNILGINLYGSVPPSGSPEDALRNAAMVSLNNGLSRSEAAVAIALDPTDRAAAGVALPSGVVIPQVTGTFVTDPASVGGKAYLLTQTLLDGAGQPLDLDNSASALRAGASAADIARQLLGSSSYTALYGSQTDTQFLDQVYQNALGRTPDPDGLSFYAGLLGGGVSRATVAADIALSPEHITDTQAAFASGIYVPNSDGSAIARLYEGVLGRDPDLLGFEHYSDTLALGGGLGQLSDEFVNSREFTSKHGSDSDTAFVTTLYENALGRDPEADGLSHYLGQLSTGTTRGAVAFDITQSPEAKLHLASSIENGVHIG